MTETKNIWTVRNSASGRFTNLKESGDVFKGARYDDKNYFFTDLIARIMGSIFDFFERRRNGLD